MSERENMFARIQEALRNQAPRPGHGEQPTGKGRAILDASSARQWLPAGGTTPEERFGLFERNCAGLKAVFQPVQNETELQTKLSELCRAEGWKHAATHRGALTNLACEGLPVPVLRVDGGYAPTALEQCDAGITECDALIAQTGSVLVTCRSAGGRALSVLPPHHVVLAKREQMMSDLPEAFGYLKQKYGGDYPSFISFITGPSRTGDIERILVLGAHGPKKLTIYCV